MNSRITARIITATAAFAVAALPLTAHAWHPEGKITKYVRNVTAGTEFADANTSSAAVAANPGDTLEYKIVLTNTAKPADKQHNDLYFLKITDKLPTGVSGTDLNYAQDAPVIPGASVEQTITVKVEAGTHGLIQNKACFTGDSKVKDRPLKGCDSAFVSVAKPQPVEPQQPQQPVEPTEPVEPAVPEAPQEPAEPTDTGKGGELPITLPETGTGIALASLAGTGSLAYAGRAYLRSRRNLIAAIKSNR